MDKESFLLGLLCGEHDLRNFGFGSDVLASWCSLYKYSEIDPMVFCEGYILGSEMPAWYAAFERNKVNNFLLIL